MTDYDDKLLDHEYDGIRELDNDLPRWWLWLFYVTITFSVLYMMYYHVLDIGYSSTEQYRSEVDPNFTRAQDIQQPRYLGILPKYSSPLGERKTDKRTFEPSTYVLLSHETDTNTYFAVNDEPAITEGREIFLARCASCHGKLGEGGVGPNLTDQYWLHRSDFTGIVKTIRYGYPTKGMISWLGHMTPEQIIKTASYVTTLQGTNPPNAKAPEGELVTEETQ